MNVPAPEDPLLHLLASLLMSHGERAKARRRVSRTLLHIFTLTRAPPLPLLREAVALASPAIKTRSLSHGAKIVQIPFALSEKQRSRQGIIWLLEASKARPGQRVEARLAREMVDVVQRIDAAGDSELTGKNRPKFPGTLGKKDEAHILAMINRGNVKVAPGAARSIV
ncbi:ribosomal protein S7 domain-containing protein [Mycena vulgaris]|nr:ribosomal protein S7 domain-containing protein [Mycena vulgaris]